MKKGIGMSLVVTAAVAFSGCTNGDVAIEQQSQEEVQSPEVFSEQAPIIVSEEVDQATSGKPAVSTKSKVILDVPLIAQYPQLKFGCEVTSLTMVLQHAGVRVNKMKLAEQMIKDKDPLIKDKNGNILHWGNPSHGFVGDVTGKTAGYAIFAGPMEKLMRIYLPDRTVNLTGKPFDALLQKVSEGKPVLVWTTGDYRIPDRWETWKHGHETIHTPLDLHAVVLVGYDPERVYVNDPLSKRKAHPVNKQMFIRTWEIMGKQGLTYR